MKAKSFAKIAASDHSALETGHKFQVETGRVRVKGIHLQGAAGSFGHFRVQLQDGASNVLLSDIESAGHSAQARYSWFAGAEEDTGYVTGDLHATRPIWDLDMEPDWKLYVSLTQSGGYGGNIDSVVVLYEDFSAAPARVAGGLVPSSGVSGAAGVSGATVSGATSAAAAADSAETVTFNTTLEATPPPPLAVEKPAPARYDPALSSATRELQGAAKQFSSLIPTLKSLPTKMDSISAAVKEWTRPPPPPPGFTADLPAQLAADAARIAKEDADAARIAKEEAAAAREQDKADKRAAWLLKSKPVKALGQDAMDLLADPTRTASQVRDGLDKLRADPRFVKLDAADRRTVSEYFTEIQKMGSKTTTGKPRGRPRKVKTA